MVVALLVMLTAGTPASHAADEPREVRALLDRMVHASRTLDYIGTFVYHNGSTIQPMKIIHRADPGGSRERLVTVSGAAREIIRDGQRVICIFSDLRAVIVAKRRPGRLYPSMKFEPEIAIGSNITEFYSLSRAGTERVADREAVVIDVQPKDRYRYGFRLAVDRRSGLLLKSELLDEGGTPLEQIVYTHLELPGSIPDEALKPRISDVGFTRYEPAVAAGSGSGSTARTREWTIGWLPSGFRMTDESHDPIQSGRIPVHHRVYSDGLASLSIFMEQGIDADDRLEGRSSIGAFNAFGRIVDGFQLGVVGEVPGLTVEKVAASIVKR